MQSNSGQQSWKRLKDQPQKVQLKGHNNKLAMQMLTLLTQNKSLKLKLFSSMSPFLPTCNQQAIKSRVSVSKQTIYYWRIHKIFTKTLQC